MIGRVLILPLFAAALCLRPPGAEACGPSFPEIVFTPRGTAAIPMERFVDGDLGVLQPYFGVRHLWPAYRVLLGRGLTASERRALQMERETAPSSADRRPAPIREWLRERAVIPGAGEPPEGLAYAWAAVTRTSRVPGEWSSYINCPEDAFRTASRTLRDRASRFGAGSPEVLAWLRAQDAVFSNCAQGRVIPEPLPSEASPLGRADRTYQIAAAHFYAEDYDAAERLFREIAADAASPWRDIAAYLVGRTLLRKATVPGKFAVPPDRGLLEAAGQQFSSLLGDPAHAAIHDAARSHLRLVQAWLDPDGYLAELAGNLAAPTEDSGIGDRLREYEFLLGDGWWDGADRPAIGDLTLWALTVRAARTRPPAARRQALAAWEQSRTLPWLCAALMTADPRDDGTDALLAAAAALPEESPAYPTAIYHRLRLLLGAGRLEEGRALATQLLESPRWSSADRNLLLAERTRTARTLEEFLADAQRLPVAAASDGMVLPGPVEHLGGRFEEAFDGRTLLDRDTESTIRQWFPLATLERAARSPALPAHLRRDFAQAHFVQAVLLGDHPAARGIAPVLRELAPEIGSGLTGYLRANEDAEADFAAAFLILNAPGLQPFVRWGGGRRVSTEEIDRFRDNWWSDLKQQSAADNGTVPAFLTPGELAVLAREREALGRLPWAPEHLGGIVLAWARTHPGDPRVPEALHLVVRATRVGASRPKSPTSRDAFSLLHRRYPRSEWADRTPYWY